MGHASKAPWFVNAAGTHTDMSTWLCWQIHLESPLTESCLLHCRECTMFSLPILWYSVTRLSHTHRSRLSDKTTINKTTNRQPNKHQVLRPWNTWLILSTEFNNNWTPKKRNSHPIRSWQCFAVTEVDCCKSLYETAPIWEYRCVHMSSHTVSCSSSAIFFLSDDIRGCMQWQSQQRPFNLQGCALGAVGCWISRAWASCMWEIRSLFPSGVKAMTYQIDTCHFLAWHLALIG